MGLFQRKELSLSQPLYNLTPDKTLLIVGLGNPGKEYENTRHNIGFVCLDNFAQVNDFPGFTSKSDLKCELSVKSLGSTRVILVKPATFMNLSGDAVFTASNYYKIPTEQILVVHDELDIPFGQIRTRLAGSDAGHNGIKSLISNIGDNFGRIRIGVGNEMSEKADSADFVLGKFTPEEQQHMPALLKEVSTILGEYISTGALGHETRSFIF